MKKFESGFFDLFDTYTEIIVCAENREEAERISGIMHARLCELHAYFDIYNPYDGINNLKTINDSAGIAPVTVSDEITGLIKFSKLAYYETDGAVNIALGPVLKIWHFYREDALTNPEAASPPPFHLLEDAAKHCDIEKIIADDKNKTVYLAEQGMSIDAGALAKGFAAQLVVDEIKNEYEINLPFLINLGGNVAASGKPPGGFWNIAVQNPQDGSGGDYLDVVRASDLSVVTSGGYQRYYEAGGVRYHHIIDPATLMPADNFSGVTVIHPDSGVADMLSTALFILPFDAGRTLAEKNNAGALWVTRDGVIYANDEFKKHN